MLVRIKNAGLFMYHVADTMVDHDGIEHAGYLAFLALLALFPFLVLIVAVAGSIGEGQLGTQFIQLTISHLPNEAILALQPRIEEITSGPPQGLLTISILGAIWTSSSAVEAMRTVLNRAYNVTTPPNFWLRRLLSIAQIIFFTVVVIILMFVIVFTPLVIKKIELATGHTISEDAERFWNQYFIFFSAIIQFLIIYSIYHFLPNIKQSMIDVIPGAVLVTLGWIGGAHFFSLYISQADQVNIIYGSLANVIASLLFFFIMSIIFIYGAEFNYALAKSLGLKIEEKEHFEHNAADLKTSEQPDK